MATTKSQRKWRDKNRYVKKQLNVMSRMLIHDYLEDIASRFGLRGKGEAVTFACFLTQALQQRATYDEDISKMLWRYTKTYHEDRDVYSA